jgi:hypothetical protein
MLLFSLVIYGIEYYYASYVWGCTIQPLRIWQHPWPLMYHVDFQGMHYNGYKCSGSQIGNLCASKALKLTNRAPLAWVITCSTTPVPHYCRISSSKSGPTGFNPRWSTPLITFIRIELLIQNNYLNMRGVTWCGDGGGSKWIVDLASKTKKHF